MGEGGFGVSGVECLDIIGAGERDRAVWQIIMEVFVGGEVKWGRGGVWEMGRWYGRFVREEMEDLMFSGMREGIGRLAPWWCVRRRLAPIIVMGECDERMAKMFCPDHLEITHHLQTGVMVVRQRKILFFPAIILVRGWRVGRTVHI